MDASFLVANVWKRCFERAASALNDHSAGDGAAVPWLPGGCVSG
jgi:hypothetical protein